MMPEKYAGADWIEDALKLELSPLGKEVADILGQVFVGIYHINKQVKGVDWKNDIYIEVVLSRELATFDSDMLTRLLVLCHDRCIRMSIEGGDKPGKLLLTFHQRQRTGSMSMRHPTIEDHIRIIRSTIALPIIEGDAS